MSWTDSITMGVRASGSLINVSDAVSDIADAAPDDEQSTNPIGNAMQAPFKAAMWMGNQYYTHVLEPYVQDPIVWAALAVQSPFWKPQGMSTWDYMRPGNDDPNSAWGARDNLSMAEAAAAGGVGLSQRLNLGEGVDRWLDPMIRGAASGALFGVGVAAVGAASSPLWDDNSDPRWERYNPVTNADESRELWRGKTEGTDPTAHGGSHYRWYSGGADFFNNLTLDPTNYVAPVAKGALASQRAARIISDGEAAALGRTRFLHGAISQTDFLKAVDEGRYATATQALAGETNALKSAVLWEELGARPADAGTLGRLTAEIDNIDDIGEFTKMIVATGSEDAEAAAAALKTKYGAGFEYEARRVTNQNPLHDEIVGTSGDLIDGPKTAEVSEDIMARAERDPAVQAALKRGEVFSRGIDALLYDSAGERVAGSYIRNALPTDTAIGKMATRGAVKRTARQTFGLVQPVVSEYKPSRFHPSVLIHERASGLISPENPDSFRELMAQMREVDKVTGGGFVQGGEAQKFIDRWFDAATLTDPQAARGSIAAGLNDYLVNALAKKHGGLEGAQAQALADAATAKMTRARSQLNNKGFLSFIKDGGDIGILRSPVLQRATANTVQMYDARALDRAFGRLGHEGLRATADGFKDSALWAMDTVNNMFKVSVLFRLGYTVRNLSEAALSIAATGNLGPVIMAVGPERFSTWRGATARAGGRLIDRIGISGGKWDDPLALSDQIVAHQANEDIAETQIQQLLDRISGVNTKKLAESGDPYKAEAARKIEEFKTVLGQREVTYHATDRPVGWKPSASEPLSTSRSLQLTQRYADARAGEKPGQIPLFGYQPRDRVQVRAVESYGDTLDLTASRSTFGFDPKDVSGARKGDRAAIKRLSDAAYERGYARLILPDGDEFGGAQVVVHPQSVGPAGMARNVDRRLAAALEDVEPVTVPKPRVGAAQRRSERSAAQKARARGERVAEPIDPEWDTKLFQSMLDNGLSDVAAQLAQRKAALKMRGDDLQARFAAAKARSERHAKLHVTNQHFGAREREFVSRNGYDYGKVKGPLGGTGGGWWERATSSDTNYHMLALGSDQGMMAGGAAVSKEVAPSSPRYFEARANIINSHFRDQQSLAMDPMVIKILDGESFDDLYEWATTTQAGYNWTHSIGATRTSKTAEKVTERAGKVTSSKKKYVDTQRTEEAIAGLMQAVDLYLPAGPIRDRFLTGEPITEDLLRQALKGQDLPPIRGLLVPTSAEAKAEWKVRDRVSSGVTQAMRVLGAIPETSFARHPLFVQQYDKEFATRVAMAEEQVGRQLTVTEWNRIDLHAKRAAKQTVENTLFTIVRRSNLSSNTAMRLAFPFFSAYENVLRRWGKFVKDDPTLPLRASILLTKMTRGAVIVDGNGERVTDPAKLMDDGTMMILPGLDSLNLPGRWGRAADSLAQQSQVPIKSLDLLFQGNPLSPGFGPFALLPAAEIIRRKPSTESVLKYLFPYGTPEGNVEMFLPTALKRFTTIGDNDSAAWTNTVSKTLLYEQWRYENGQRPDKPTMPEVLEKAKSYYLIRTAAALLSPAAVSFTNERDFYASKMRTLQKVYGRDEGEARFFQEHPNAALLVQSLSKNDPGMIASVGSVEATQKYGQEIADAYGQGDPELAGFIANYGQPDSAQFSQAAYQWQRAHGAPGSPDTFRQVANPEESVREAHIAEGWRIWRGVVEGVASNLTSAGFQPEDAYYKDRMAAAKKQVLSDLQGNKDWVAEYTDPDSSKYYRRGNFFEGLLSNSQFVQDHKDDPLMQSIQVYFAYRKRVQEMLKQRAEMGGSRTLTANANYDIQSEWESIVDRLKTDSPEFSAWVDRYFANDPVPVIA